MNVENNYDYIKFKLSLKDNSELESKKTNPAGLVLRIAKSLY